MAGHSKWANIKHRKGAQDAKRAKVFQKLSKEIQVAMREGGNDPDNNARLKMVIEKAKAGNLPLDNIKRLLSSKDKNSANWTEVVYEGYGPGGAAVLVYCLTDNTNRTAATVKASFTKLGGNLGTAGSVSYLFENKGLIVFENTILSSEEAMTIALASGALDFKEEEGVNVIETKPSDFTKIKKSFDDAGVEEYIKAEVLKIPLTTVVIKEQSLPKLERLIHALEDNDDVQDVYTNVE